MKMIQIRNVPDDLHRALKERAAREGTTMSKLLLDELPRIADRRSVELLLDEILAGDPVDGPSGAELVRADRAAR